MIEHFSRWLLLSEQHSGEPESPEEAARNPGYEAEGNIGRVLFSHPQTLGSMDV